jgi:hypothetical protein
MQDSMRWKVIGVLIGIAAVGAWTGYTLVYKHSSGYRAKVQARFQQLQLGDSYERMVQIVGSHPTHHRQVQVLAATIGAPSQHYRDFIYRIGDTDFVARFSPSGAGRFGPMIEKRGPVPTTRAAEWSR